MRGGILPGRREKGETVARFAGFVAALCTGLVAASANAAVTFSFASDTNNDGPTFFGGPLPGGPVNGLSDGAAFDSSGAVIVNLMVDPNGDLPGGGSAFNSVFDFDGVSTGYSVGAFAGGFVHVWSFSGSFTFTDTGTGLEVLRIDFTNALFTSFSSDQFELGPSATLQANAATDAGLSFTPGMPLAGLGITAADLSAQEGFAFGLTNLRSIVPGMPLHLGQGGSWFHPWIAEGSFSASAVPGPAAAALLGAAALIGRRRRRL